MQSVADLVENVAQGHGVDSDLYKTAVRLVDAGVVVLGEFGPLVVSAKVGEQEVTLQSKDGLLLISTGTWTPSSLAVAIIVWNKAPKRQK